MRITERADSRRLSRADFLRLSGLTATAVLLGTGELQSGRAYAAPSFAADPFSLGVASGDPEHNSVVLWTRLAPEPLAADGHGGMPPDPVTVRYEVATDDGFHHVVHHGAVEATAELGHSVHAEVRGLRPGYEYFYRFKAGADTSSRGPDADDAGRPRRLAALRAGELPALAGRLLHGARRDRRAGPRSGRVRRRLHLRERDRPRGRHAAPAARRRTSGTTAARSIGTAASTGSTSPTRTCKPRTRPTRGSPPGTTTRSTTTTRA